MSSASSTQTSATQRGAVLPPSAMHTADAKRNRRTATWAMACCRFRRRWDLSDRSESGSMGG